jgi:GAF domain-containing protein
VTEPQELLTELGELASMVADTVAPAALDDGVRAVTATARRFFGAAACSIAVFDEDSDELEYVAASGAGAAAIVGVRLPLGRGIAGWVAQSGQALAVSDLSSDTRFARDVAESTAYVPQALLAAPIESDDRLFGVLSVLDRDQTRPTAASDLESASLFAAQAAAILQAREAFADAGRVVLQALADAAAQQGSLAETLTGAARSARRNPGLREFSALLAELYRAGPDARRLGVDVLRTVLAYANTSTGGTSSLPT